MPRWKDLPEELDPQIKEFTQQVRRLVDRSGLSVAALADRTGYSKTSWERYLGGRLLAPKGAIVALAEVTGTNLVHLTTMWELAERAWSRAEMRHDRTMEAIRISQARAALGEFGAAEATGGPSGRKGAGAATGIAGPAGVSPTIPAQPTAPDADAREGAGRERGDGRDRAAGPDRAGGRDRADGSGRGEGSGRADGSGRGPVGGSGRGSAGGAGRGAVDGSVSGSAGDGSWSGAA
ncbi:helix-turn-helix domain-containing protein, partial [Streptomyces puniciscabiei]|uniref:helix-turn-helix domain-containing protein n=1 Tax=Streptomyces puniciscabiei TaxID=164348 RepID=UPI000AD8E6F7